MPPEVKVNKIRGMGFAAQGRGQTTWVGGNLSAAGSHIPGFATSDRQFEAEAMRFPKMGFNLSARVAAKMAQSPLGTNARPKRKLVIQLQPLLVVKL